MPYIAYTAKRFNAKSLAMIDQVNKIIEEYMAQGFKLTLRQLYYQFVARDLLPDSWIDEAYNLQKGLARDTKNTEKNYKRLGGIINKGRMAGLIDWHAIEDRTRNVETPSHWDSPTDILSAAASAFRIDKWEGQTFRPEVWIEKEALAGVIEGVCRKLDISYLSCRGYTSQSEMWSSAMRLKAFAESQGQTPIILHFGDHDPSGLDMTRDIRDRLSLFTGTKMDLERLALNMDQIDEFKPPPNPAKTTDSRFKTYLLEFGDESWELDALEPSTLVKLIEDSVALFRDGPTWDAKVREENEYRATLDRISKTWE